MTDWVQRPQETQRLWEMPIAGLHIDLENQEFSSTGTQGSLHKHFWIEHPLKKALLLLFKIHCMMFTREDSQANQPRILNFQHMRMGQRDTHIHTHTAPSGNWNAYSKTGHLYKNDKPFLPLIMTTILRKSMQYFFWDTLKGCRLFVSFSFKSVYYLSG